LNLVVSRLLSIGHSHAPFFKKKKNCMIITIYHVG